MPLMFFLWLNSFGTQIITLINKSSSNYTFITIITRFNHIRKQGGVQNLEWLNVERPIFRNFKITNIKIAKDELVDFFIVEFISYSYFF